MAALRIALGDHLLVPLDLAHCGLHASSKLVFKGNLLLRYAWSLFAFRRRRRRSGATARLLGSLDGVSSGSLEVFLVWVLRRRVESGVRRSPNRLLGLNIYSKSDSSITVPKLIISETYFAHRARAQRHSR